VQRDAAAEKFAFGASKRWSVESNTSMIPMALEQARLSV
jgi:hypothetical protein